jgi:hypothetical protein
VTFDILRNLHLRNVEVELLEKVEFLYSDLSNAKNNRNYIEYLFCLTPFLIKYILEVRKQKVAVYLDSDLFFFSNPEAVHNGLEDYEIGINAHNFPKELEDLNVFGKNNVGMLFFRNTKKSLEILNWWANKCLESTSLVLTNDSYGDQKYLDQFEVKSDRLHITRKLGENSAPWNCREVKLVEGRVMFADQSELFYFHFSGLRVYSYFSLLGFELYSIKPSRRAKEYIYRPYLKIIKEKELLVFGRIRSDSRKVTWRRAIRTLKFSDFLFNI